MDKNTNAHGLKLLDLCKSTSMRVANGRLHCDQSGSFTFILMLFADDMVILGRTPSELQKHFDMLNVLPSTLRNSLSRLRLSSHKLRIETGRYAQNRIERNQRYCTIQIYIQ